MYSNNKTKYAVRHFLIELHYSMRQKKLIQMFMVKLNQWIILKCPF